MSHHHHTLEWRGREVVDRDGDKIGKLEEIYLDQQTGEPEWALVNTGLFGTKSSFVPLEGAADEDGNVRVSYEKAQIKDAPSIDPNGALSQQEEQALYQHYGRSWDGGRSDAGRFETEAGGPGHDTSGPNTDNAM